MSKLACYIPADGADHADECSKAALLRRERQLGVVHVVLWLFEVCCLEFVVLGFVCVNLRDQRENRPFTHTKNYVDEYKEQQ